MSHLLGIDYGTSQFKIQLYDLKGKVSASTDGTVQVIRTKSGWVEQNMDQGWRSVSHSIQDIIRQAGIDPSTILAVGITGTTNINLFDQAGRILRPAILYGDERIPPEVEIKRIKDQIGAKKIGAQFGFDALDESTWTILLRLLPSSKLLWVREHEPDIFSLVHHCTTSSWDFINVQLTGKVTHWENALEIDRLILETLDLPTNFFGEGLKAGDIVGTVHENAATESGLAVGTPVIMGVTDSLSSFLGAGIIREGIALNAAGTTDVVAVSLEGQPSSTVGYPVRHLLGNLWLLSLSPVRGPTLDWFKDTLLPPGATYADLDALASTAPAGADGLLCLPYFTGEKGLIHDPFARGAIVGFDLHHGPAHMARACLEGIAMSLRQILEAFREEGANWDELRVCGGGARSDLWNQTKADVLGMEIRVLRVLETGCLGAATLASVAVGVYGDLFDASSGLSQVKHVLEPNPRNREMYDELYEAFLRLYPAIRPSLNPMD